MLELKPPVTKVTKVIEICLQPAQQLQLATVKQRGSGQIDGFMDRLHSMLHHFVSHLLQGRGSQ
jgi:hypothetical protein